MLLERHHVVPSTLVVRLVHQAVHVLYVLQHVEVVSAEYLNLILRLFVLQNAFQFLVFILRELLAGLLSNLSIIVIVEFGDFEL